MLLPLAKHYSGYHSVGVTRLRSFHISHPSTDKNVWGYMLSLFSLRGRYFFYKDICPFANLYPDLLQLPLPYLYGGSLLSLLYILPATMEDRNEDTEGWGVTLPIYTEREGRTDPVYCPQGEERLWLTCLLGLQGLGNFKYVGTVAQSLCAH